MPQAKEIESAQHEYTEVCAIFRHYSGLRFAIMTVFFALTGGIMTIAYSAQTDPIRTIRLQIIGLITVLVFWFFEERLIALADHLLLRAEELERVMGYKAFLTRPKSSILPFLKTAYATRLIYSAILGFWALSFFL